MTTSERMLREAIREAHLLRYEPYSQQGARVLRILRAALEPERTP